GVGKTFAGRVERGLRPASERKSPEREAQRLELMTDRLGLLERAHDTPTGREHEGPRALACMDDLDQRPVAKSLRHLTTSRRDGSVPRWRAGPPRTGDHGPLEGGAAAREDAGGPPVQCCLLERGADVAQLTELRGQFAVVWRPHRRDRQARGSPAPPPSPPLRRPSPLHRPPP